MTIDARDVTIVFGQYVEIMRLWDAGKIDGAACWAPCLDHVLTKPHGGTGAPGALLYDAETLLRWGFGAVRRADISPMNRGDVAAAMWTFRGDKSHASGTATARAPPEHGSTTRRRSAPRSH